MMYALLTYRGMQPDFDYDAVFWVGMYTRMQKDAKEGRLDPFPSKRMG